MVVQGGLSTRFMFAPPARGSFVQRSMQRAPHLGLQLCACELCAEGGHGGICRVCPCCLPLKPSLQPRISISAQRAQVNTTLITARLISPVGGPETLDSGPDTASRTSSTGDLRSDTASAVLGLQRRAVPPRLEARNLCFQLRGAAPVAVTLCCQELPLLLVRAHRGYLQTSP